MNMRRLFNVFLKSAIFLQFCFKSLEYLVRLIIQQYKLTILTIKNSQKNAILTIVPVSKISQRLYSVNFFFTVSCPNHMCS